MKPESSSSACLQVRESRDFSRVEVSKDLDQFINRDDFNIDYDFYLNLKDDPRRDKKYTTSYTTLALEYDNNDIVEVLKTLTIEDYSETKIDTDDVHPPILYVFGKKIDEKLVYIKLKIKNKNIEKGEKEYEKAN